MQNGLKQFGVRDTGLLSGQFHQARVRLTALYLILLAAILFVSSYTIYANFSGRVERRFEKSRPAQRFMPPSMVQPIPRPEEVKEDLIMVLVLVNGVLLLVAGVSSYWLAGSTLKPVQDAYDRQRRFLADASHELRTPLAILQTDLENERDQSSLKSSEKEKVLSHLEEVGRMSALVTDLITLSHIDVQSELNRSSEIIVIEDEVREVVHRLARFAKQQSVRLELAIPAEQKNRVKGSRELVTQSLANVIKNAVLYNKVDGLVTVQVSSIAERVLVTVTDTGIGIGQTDLDHIFERFYRADPSRSRQTGGSGLGLAIVRESVKQLGGEIQIKSTIGKGTVVTLSLPTSRLR